MKCYFGKGIRDGLDNAENRPVRWECGDTIVTMDFGRMGRRTFSKEEVNDVVTKHHKFVYDNYLCVQKLDALNNNAQINLFEWDPTEPIATRPLFMLSNPGSYKFFYTFDGNKNVSELVHFETRNGIAAHYDYAPFGAVTRAISASAATDNTFTIDNPFRFSSEYHDDTLGLVYYRERERTFHGHYRHYNPVDGRWCGRDSIVSSLNLFLFASNNAITKIDAIERYEFFRSLELIFDCLDYDYSSLSISETRRVFIHLNEQTAVTEAAWKKASETLNEAQRKVKDECAN